MKVNIYTLEDPITKEIRYIGRTKNSLKVRLSGHLSKSKKGKNHKDNWLKNLTNQKLKPIINLLEVVEGWTESYQKEQQIIKEYLKKGFNLVNLHDRGEGGLLRSFSQEQKDKISNTVKKLHNEGKLSCGRKMIDLYDLNGVFIKHFESYKECANYLSISEKQIQISIKRKAKSIKKFQYKLINTEIPLYYINESHKGKNLKLTYVYDIINSKEIIFNSREELADYFKVNYTTLYYYLKNNKLYKQQFQITNARIKLDELSGKS